MRIILFWKIVSWISARFYHICTVFYPDTGEIVAARQLRPVAARSSIKAVPDDVQKGKLTLSFIHLYPIHGAYMDFDAK